MGEAGRRWVETEWSWDLTVRRLTRLLMPEPERLPESAHRG
jgi:phosphatidylinositol alpha-1,6-mannosyltransferase